MLDGFDGDTPRLRAPASQATVKQLVTHTTGLGYWFWNEDLVRWEAVTGTPNVLSGDERRSSPRRCSPTRAPRSSTASTPTGWARSSRRPAASALDVAIKEGITGPLGMDETAFLIADGVEGGGLTPVHVKGDGRQLGRQRRSS